MGVKQIRNVFVAMLCLLLKGVVAQPLQFTENKGQWDTRILYESDIFSGKLYLEKSGFTYYFLKGEDYAQFQHMAHAGDPPSRDFTLHFHAIKTRFLGANSVTPDGDYGYSFYRNYFIGRNRNNWASKVPVHQAVRYKDLYEGIDLILYGQQQSLKYDWLIRKGANPEEIRVSYDGATDLFIDDGKLFVRTSFNHFIEQRPVAYQMIKGERVEVECQFVLNGKTLSYKLAAYNKDYDLIIDPPILIFATYSGSSADNFGFTATYDSRGNLYAAGNVTDAYSLAPNGRFPTTAGAYQVNPAGFIGASGPYGFFQCDMAISKYDSSGQNLLWATYFGGTDNDYPHSLVVDNSDRLVVMGSTYSTDFPMDTNCFDTSHNGLSDIVVAKFSTDGSTLNAVTFIGGNRNDGVLVGNLIYNFADNFRGDVQVSKDGNIYVASSTNSTQGLPTTSNALSSSLNGGYDGLLFELDSNLSNLLWCTYWGGNGDDALYSVRIDKSQNLIVGGGTQSDSIFTTANALSRNYSGATDGMALRVDITTKTVLASTYIGTSSYDQVYFVDFDPKNHVYAFGQTEGVFPVIGNPYNFPQGGQFLIKMDESLDSVLMSTTLGSRVRNPNFSPTAFLVDNCYNIYFAGWGSDAGGHPGTTNGLDVTPDAMQPSTDGNDFYLGVLDKNAQNLVYATYFGGTQTSDHVDGGTSRFDKRGIVYHSVCGSCPPYPCCTGPQYFISDIPTTSTAAFPTNLSPRCSNASFKLDFNITYAVESDFIAAPKVGCMPLTVNFTNRSFQGTRFEWHFGDGTIDTGYNATHTYTQEGKFTAYLKVTDSMSCNLTDSIFVEIQTIVSTPADFDFTIEPCGKEVTFTVPDNVQAPLGYFWDFGDGTTSTDRTPKHEFSQFGVYTVKLITNPLSPCRDSAVKQISLTEPVRTDLFIPNVFTPNDDDPANPCYTFGGLRSCDEVEIEIYNRYAQLVFESDDLNFCWTGADMKSGKLLPAGVYYIIARVRQAGGQWEEYKGTVTMMY